MDQLRRLADDAVQEYAIIHFHKVLAAYKGTGAPGLIG